MSWRKAAPRGAVTRGGLITMLVIVGGAGLLARTWCTVHRDTLRASDSSATHTSSFPTPLYNADD